jgi:hypothetical protein
MLHKNIVMNLVIIYVIMNLFYNSRSLEICWIEMQVHSIGDMHQVIDLRIILLCILHLILNLNA